MKINNVASFFQSKLIQLVANEMDNKFGTVVASTDAIDFKDVDLEPLLPKTFFQTLEESKDAVKAFRSIPFDWVLKEGEKLDCYIGWMPDPRIKASLCIIIERGVSNNTWKRLKWLLDAKLMVPDTEDDDGIHLETWYEGTRAITIDPDMYWAEEDKQFMSFLSKHATSKKDQKRLESMSRRNSAPVWG